MPQDAFTVYHTAKELNTALIGARVDRIIQPEKDTVVFYLRVNNKNVFLTAC
ncbi:MAG: NFACT family protein, partial [Clostridia bacterium]|nr:NFACT family protein [Clostridia bacterium]